MLRKAEQMILEYAGKKKMKIFPSAYAFAKERHAGHFRDSGELYDTHLSDGCFILMSLKIGDDEIFSGYGLHDVVESGRATLEEIRELFGEKIAELVNFLDKRNIATGLYFLRLSLIIKAAIIKAVDRLSNMRDMADVYALERQEGYLDENEDFIFRMIKKALTRRSRYQIQLLVILRILEILNKIIRESVNRAKEIIELKAQLARKEEEIKALKEKIKE